MEWLFITILILCALCFGFEPMLKHKRYSNGVVNYNASMDKFVYRVESTEKEILELLKTHNVSDVLNYDVNDTFTVITFKKFNAKSSYQIFFEPYNDYVILKIELISPFQNILGYYINEFWVQKIQAIPLDYQSNCF